MNKTPEQVTSGERWALRTAIRGMERNMMQRDQAQSEIIHHFAPGLYAREMRIGKDTVVVGKIHRFAHLTTISSGSALVLTERGGFRVDAPYTFKSEPGDKRSIRALTDLIWTTYHPNPDDLTDVQALEEILIADDYLDGPGREQLDVLLERQEKIA